MILMHIAVNDKIKIILAKIGTSPTPKIALKCSKGFATVAEHEMNLTSLLPIAAQIRRSLRMINATCDPI